MPNHCYQEELNLDHEPSLDHWARLIADSQTEEEDLSSDWDYAYEQAWNYLTGSMCNA